MNKRKVLVRRTALFGLVALANGVVAIATDYSDYEPGAFLPLAKTTGTLMSDFSLWERTSASGLEGLEAVRSGYYGFVLDQEDDG